MTNQELTPEEQNQEAYDDLIVSIEAKKQALSLLIAVCDDLNLREQIIAQYEEELQPEFRCYRVTLARGEPSLKSAINRLVQQEEYLCQGNPAIITVTGAEKLYFLKLGEARSEQEKFFGYLQWTREALRRFPFSIVLWVTNPILENLIKKAPDFWSWRSGVFRFLSQKTNLVSNQEHETIRFPFSDIELASADDNSDNPYFLPIEDLQQLIQKLESQGAKNSRWATLYSRLGDIYKRRLDCGEAQDSQLEQDLGIQYYYKAAELQRELGLDTELLINLSHLAELYYSQKRYHEAEQLFQQVLELTKRLLGEDHPDVATSLSRLASLYYTQGRYGAAEPLYQQALELRKRLLGNEHPSVIISLNELALLYQCQGRNQEAESLYQQALELTKHLQGEEYPSVAVTLSNLAGFYHSIGRYREAIPLYEQALEVCERLWGHNHSYTIAIRQNFEQLGAVMS
jgi:tetratricopeptide (TPR) repeat protein